MPRRKAKWANGDVFAVPLRNGQVAIGQVLDLMMTNVVRVALYAETFASVASIDLNACCQPANLISLVASSREQLDYRVWTIAGNKSIEVPLARFPNEQFRARGWVGAIHYDAALLEDFLEAFHALRPWDDWYDPNYLDAFLLHPGKKPGNLILMK